MEVFIFYVFAVFNDSFFAFLQQQKLQKKQ